MSASSGTDGQGTRVGALIKRWRTTRRISQLDLALAAQVSTRHLSFLETGRARPSRQMLLLLGSVLDLPFRERNALLQAAGFASEYQETPLEDPSMAAIRHALQLILRQHEPFAAVALDRRWDIVMVNAPYAGILAGLLGGTLAAPEPLTLVAPPRPNALRLLFDPAGFRPHIANWDLIARDVLGRLHREVLWTGDEATAALLKELLANQGVPSGWREPDLEATPSIVLPVELQLGECRARFFTTLTTLGTPQDITLQELRVESFHPVDSQTEELVRGMGVQGST
jgi:transcriptional regulator with XRE-family HTH domain